MELLLRIMLLSLSIVGFIGGAFAHFGKRAALFKKLVTASVGCFMLGRLYELITFLIIRQVPEEFNIGMISAMGGFMFIFSASYAQMDGLVDDRNPDLAKYRVLPLLAPVVVMGLYVPVAFSTCTVFEKIFTGAMFLGISAATYYNLKHLIIPDVTFGIISSIRSYSLVAMLLLLSYAVQIMAVKLGLDLVYAVSSVLVALGYPLLIIAMERGSKKWTL